MEWYERKARLFSVTVDMMAEAQQVAGSSSPQGSPQRASKRLRGIEPPDSSPDCFICQLEVDLLATDPRLGKCIFLIVC